MRKQGNPIFLIFFSLPTHISASPLLLAGGAFSSFSSSSSSSSEK
jgi:hypothetical protein